VKKLLLSGLIFAVLFVGLFVEAQAQETYPSRPIELVVPFGPGGAASVTARAYSDNLAKLLKVPITVVNRAGGTGIQGTAYVIKSKKDGYTLLAATDTPLMVMPVISKEITYDPLKDLIPIGHIGYAPAVFAVKSDSPFKTLANWSSMRNREIKNASPGLNESF
jgi:tripartite-type tricarboxylate transporter receptor subunit TctC